MYVFKAIMHSIQAVQHNYNKAPQLPPRLRCTQQHQSCWHTHITAVLPCARGALASCNTFSTLLHALQLNVPLQGFSMPHSRLWP